LVQFVAIDFGQRIDSKQISGFSQKDLRQFSAKATFSI